MPVFESDLCIIGGGISAVFSDLLGNHTVAGTVQMTNRFDEAGGSLVYLNRAHRWNWGAAVDSTPMCSAGSARAS